MQNFSRKKLRILDYERQLRPDIIAALQPHFSIRKWDQCRDQPNFLGQCPLPVRKQHHCSTGKVEVRCVSNGRMRSRTCWLLIRRRPDEQIRLLSWRCHSGQAASTADSEIKVAGRAACRLRGATDVDLSRFVGCLAVACCGHLIPKLSIGGIRNHVCLLSSVRPSVA